MNGRTSSLLRRTWAVSALVGSSLVFALGGCHSSASTAPPLQHAESTQAASASPAATDAAKAGPAPTPATFDAAQLAERVMPTVVNITTKETVTLTSVHPFEMFGRRGVEMPDREQTRVGVGTGFIIDADGFVVTNEHVVHDADELVVRLADEREFEAEVVGRDSKLDLALIKLRGASNLPAASLGDSDVVRVGESVMAVGNPYGLGHTVTLGIVSAKARAIGAGPYDEFIQTDASINPGNSGGPLFNWKGEVVGINAAIRAGANGIGFAIPVSSLKDVLPQLRERGFVERGKLGLVFQPVSKDLATALGTTTTKGALISDLEANGPAARAGLKAGDVITAVNGTAIGHAEDLPRTVAKNAPGAKVQVTYLRGGKSADVTVTLDKLRDDDSGRGAKTPDRKAKPQSAGKLGIEVSDAASGGVRVDNVTGKAGDLKAGDVIVEVNGSPVIDSAALRAAVAKVKAGSTALMKVKRGRIFQFAAVPVPQ
ncbi:MAG: Do family serine endopeptidase [Polyangiaceae bacterium]|nr:Do family serine endopeptidase [Polyangiaceae bacterium]